MLISKRRLQWSAIGLLVLCLLALITPIRAGMQSWLFGRILSQQLSFSDLRLHSRQPVVEAVDVRWAGPSATPDFEVRSRRAWLTYDQAALRQGIVRLPKVVLERADVMPTYREHCPAEAEAVDANLRYRQVAARLAGTHDPSSSPSLMAIRSLQSQWANHLQQWTTRSRQIAAQAAAWSQQSVGMDNSLRFGDVIEQQLQQLSNLQEEQGLLATRIQDLCGQCPAQWRQLEALHQQDQQRLRDEVAPLNAQTAADPQVQELCNELALAKADAHWRQVADYARLLHQLAHAATSQHRLPFDVDVRHPQRDNLLAEIGLWTASGRFFGNSPPVPYRAAGRWSCRSPARADACSTFDCRAEFELGHSQLRIRGSRLMLPLPVTKLVMLHRPAADSPGDASRIVLTIDGQQIVGQLSLISHEQTPSDSSTDLNFAILGSWATPQLTPHGHPPEWLATQVAVALEQQLKDVAAERQQQLAEAFQSELTEVQESLQEALQLARALTAEHGRQLAGLRSHLETQVATMRGTEFATRPAEVVR